MPTQVLMPQLGESVDEGTITKWLKAPGEPVEEYEPLLEINTDKVDTEIPSPSSGILLEILVQEGALVKAGTLLAWIGESGEALPDASPPGAVEEPVAQKTKDVEIVKAPPAPAAPPLPSASLDRELGFISPVVARIAAEHSVDLFQVSGTGRGGRITKKDILAYLEGQPKMATQPTPELKVGERSPQPGEVLSLSPLRKLIADHMVKSKQTSPHVTTVMEVDLSRVVAHREANKGIFARDGVKLTYTAYFVAATVAALKAFPLVNSSWSEDGILLHREINIGMATSLDEAGLIVPVIKNADALSLLGVASAVNDLANRARARGLQPDEVQPGPGA